MSNVNFPSFIVSLCVQCHKNKTQNQMNCLSHHDDVWKQPVSRWSFIFHQFGNIIIIVTITIKQPVIRWERGSKPELTISLSRNFQRQLPHETSVACFCSSQLGWKTEDSFSEHIRHGNLCKPQRSMHLFGAPESRPKQLNTALRLALGNDYWGLS